MVGYRSNSSRVAVVVVGILLAAPAVVMAASAGDPAAVAKVTDLNKQALAAYSQQDYDTAKNLLKQALQTCADAGLDQHPITARTHLHFGAVAITGFKQRDAGIKQFKKALEIQPDIKLTKSIATPELQDAFEEAVLASNGGEKLARRPPAAKVKPARRRGRGRRRTPRPTTRTITPPPKPKAKPPRSRATRTKRRRRGSRQGRGLLPGPDPWQRGRHRQRLGPRQPDAQAGLPGFASGQLGQVEPQVGYFLDAKTLLSLALRLQYVSGTNGEPGCGTNGSSYCNPTTFAMAALARATWFLGDGPLHWTVGGQVGAGYVAHAVSFPQKNCGMNGNTGCVDALLGGAFLIGPTAGLWYDLGTAWASSPPSTARLAPRSSRSTSTSTSAWASGSDQRTPTRGRMMFPGCCTGACTRQSGGRPWCSCAASVTARACWRNWSCATRAAA